MVCFDCEEEMEDKEHATHQKGKECKYNKKKQIERKKGRSNDAIHHMFIVCFNGKKKF